MILDALLQLSNAQAVTASAVSTNTIDFGNVTPKNDPFNGEPLALVLCVSVAADFTTTDETYTLQAITSAAADLSGAVVLVQRAILAVNLTAGSVHVLTIPPTNVMLRYFGANYLTGGTTPTLTASLFLVPLKSVGIFKTYAEGFTVK